MKVLVDTRRAMFDLAILCPVLLIGATAFMETWEGKRFVFFYLAPIFGMLFLWAFFRMKNILEYPLFLGVLDAVVIALAGLRFFGMLPFSGHVLFFTYSGATTNSLVYRILAGVFLLETTIFKLKLWSDWQSWSLGLLVSAIAITAYFFIINKMNGLHIEKVLSLGTNEEKNVHPNILQQRQP